MSVMVVLNMCDWKQGGLVGRRPPNGHEPEDFILASTFEKSDQKMRSGHVFYNICANALLEYFPCINANSKKTWLMGSILVVPVKKK